LSKTGSATLKENEDVTTLKVISFNLLLLSKVLAYLHSCFTIFSQSRIMVSGNRCYYCFVNLKNEEVSERLQEITPYRSV
jgi:hypothetical protein